MRTLFALILIVIAAGCQVETDELRLDSLPPDEAPIRREYPTVNLPRGLRQQNWVGDRGEGSCVHASMVMLFRWQGFPAMADWWRANNANGEWAEDLAQRFNNANVRFAQTTTADVNFLQWACDTRRGAGVTVMGGRLMVCLVHLDETWAGILDNNDIDNIHWVPRETFLAEWRASHGWAVTPIYWPAPPLPQ
jgi:hypothetical protein